MKKLIFLTMAIMFVSLSGMNAYGFSTTLYSTQDAEIMRSSGANTTVNGTNYGALEYMSLNWSMPGGPAGTTLFPSGSDSFALFQFDLSSLPAGSILQSATLTLFSANYASNPTAWPSTVFPITQAWNELTVTYNNRPTRAATGVSRQSGSVFPLPGTFIYDLTALTQDWLDGDVLNYGLMTNDVHYGLVSGGRYYTRLYGHESPGTDCDPRLEITYTPPEPPAQVIPEPATVMLLGLGIVGLRTARRRRSLKQTS